MKFRIEVEIEDGGDPLYYVRSLRRLYDPTFDTMSVDNVTKDDAIDYLEDFTVYITRVDQ